MSFDTEVLGAPSGADATEVVTGAELEALALAADPLAPLAEDAVPYDQVLGTTESLLPDWYLGRAASAHASRWRRPVVLGIIAAFLLIDAAGLCSTYGIVTFA